MKKIMILLLLLVVFLPINIYAEEDLIPNATSGVLMDAATGTIIYEKEKDKEVAVASMTKMVAQIIILENIESKKIKWDDVVTVSKNAADMGGSQIYLAANEKMTVRDLFKGISMASANDAVVAMAEYISGTEDKFVKKMNDKVKSLGLKHTVFKNSTGLDEEGHFSSAYDMAIIAKELLSHEEILKFSSVYEDYLRTDTPNKFWLVNTNKLIHSYPGSDGLKTGHTDNAKYCIAATAKKDDMRLIAIVLGEDTAKVRNEEASKLLDYGFNSKKSIVIKKKTDVVKKISLEKATKKTLKISPKEDITVLTDKTVDSKKYKERIVINKINIPLKKNEKVGTIKIYLNKKLVTEEDLVASSSVEKLGFFRQLLSNLKGIPKVVN